MLLEIGSTSLCIGDDLSEEIEMFAVGALSESWEPLLRSDYSGLPYAILRYSLMLFVIL